MAIKVEDLTGRQFGRLTVLGFSHLGRDSSGRGRGSYWTCQCSCPDKTIVQVSRTNLIGGFTKSCGCLLHEIDDLTGKTYGRLHVVGMASMKNGRSMWRCKCTCGNETEVIVEGSSLKNGHTTSCGCRLTEVLIARNTTHGMTKTPLHRIWCDMHTRCNNPNYNKYHRYGGRGISICQEWDNFETFYDWAIHNGYEPGLSIDRIDNDGIYCPENCRWVDMVIQANNRSTNCRVTYNGETKTIAEWSRLLGVPNNTLKRRIDRDDYRDFENYFEG